MIYDIDLKRFTNPRNTRIYLKFKINDVIKKYNTILIILDV